MRKELKLKSSGKMECGPLDEGPRLPVDELTPAGVREVIRNSNRPVVIRFGKEHCGWTRSLDSALLELIPEYRDRVDFYQADIIKHPELRSEWAISTSPMMLRCEAGEELDRSDAAEDWEVVPVLEQWFGQAEDA